MSIAAIETKSGLPRRQLGLTDMAITPVGFGAWAIGGADWAAGWGKQDDRDSIATIRRALDRGINWIDTAAVYGLGHSEKIVAETLKEIPSSCRPYVFTKCGLVWDAADRRAQTKTVGRSASIRSEVEDSLRRLRVDRIDLYQMHFPAKDGTPLEEYWQTMLDLKAEGKVRAVGLSNHDANQLDVAESLGHVDAMQPPFSAIRRDAAAELIPWCEAHQTGVIVYSPMQSGLLTGEFSVKRSTQLPSDDWRSRNPEFQGERLNNNLRLADAMKKIAQDRGTTAGAVAIAWTLAWPGVNGAIVGARLPVQVDGWIAGATLRLSEDEIHRISMAISVSKAGSGPRSPFDQTDYSGKAALATSG